MTTKIPLISQTAKQKGQNLRFQTEIWTERMIMCVRARGFFLLQKYIHKNLRFSSFLRHFCPFLECLKPIFSAKNVTSGRPRHPVRASRHVRNGDFLYFLIAVFAQKRHHFLAVRALLHCNGATIIMQRQPRCNAIRPLRQTNGALTASPSWSNGELTKTLQFANNLKSGS